MQVKLRLLLEKVARFCKRTVQLDYPQAATLRLGKCCGVSRVAHTLRVLHPSVMKTFVEEFDKLMLDALESISGDFRQPFQFDLVGLACSPQLCCRLCLSSWPLGHFMSEERTPLLSLTRGTLRCRTHVRSSRKYASFCLQPRFSVASG